MAVQRPPPAKFVDAALYYTALSLFGVSSLLASVVAVPLHALLPRAMGVRFGRAAISACFRTYLRAMERLGLLRLDLSVLETLRAERRLLIVANHPSILDAVLVVSRLPLAACIMKSSLGESRILGGSARLAGYIRNTPSHRLIRDAVSCLKDGGQLLVFPEGTRTREAKMDAFAAGFAIVARKAGVPVQSLLIEIQDHGGWRRSIFDVPRLPLVYRIRLGRRYHPSDDARHLSDRIEHDLRHALQPDAADPVPASQKRGTSQ